MFCPSCGNALSQQLKYCNRCGANLATTDLATLEALERRLNGYLDGLFWITVLGLAATIGGMILMKRFQFSDILILAFMALSSVAFIVNFAINLREVQRIKRLRETSNQIGASLNSQQDLPPARVEMLSSVTDQTTRNLEEVPRQKGSLQVGADSLRNV